MALLAILNSKHLCYQIDHRQEAPPHMDLPPCPSGWIRSGYGFCLSAPSLSDMSQEVVTGQKPFPKDLVDEDIWF